MERLLKWVRRRPAVAGLLAGLVLVTAIGVAGILWKYFEAEARRITAEEAEEKAENRRLAAEKAEKEAEQKRQELEKERREQEKELGELREMLNFAPPEEDWRMARTDILI